MGNVPGFNITIPSDQKPFTAIVSLMIGYHKPWKHKGMTRDAFLDEFCDHMEKRHYKLRQWMEEHQGPVAYFLKNNFHATLIDASE